MGPKSIWIIGVPLYCNIFHIIYIETPLFYSHDITNILYTQYLYTLLNEFKMVATIIIARTGLKYKTCKFLPCVGRLDNNRYIGGRRGDMIFENFFLPMFIRHPPILFPMKV